MKNLALSDPMSAAEAAGIKTVSRRVIDLGPDPGRARLHSWDGRVATFGDSIPDDPVPSEKRSRFVVGEPVYFGEALIKGPVESAKYRRDGAVVQDWAAPLPGKVMAWRWQRSVLAPRFCPEACARRFGVIVDVRPERLRDITTEDVANEGVLLELRVVICACEGPDPGPGHRPDCAWRDPDYDPCGIRAIDEFAILWNSINRDRAPWNLNPWVWRIEWRSVSREVAIELQAQRRAAA